MMVCGMMLDDFFHLFFSPILFCEQLIFDNDGKKLILKAKLKYEKCVLMAAHS